MNAGLLIQVVGRPCDALALLLRFFSPPLQSARLPSVVYAQPPMRLSADKRKRLRGVWL
ncbi:hypothetical protein D3C85_1369820 [compost metagenome]